jgi:DNA-binding IclR family transcriptional regulator
LDKPIPSAGADRVLYLLATLAQEGRPLTVAALAEHTGMATSTIYRQVALLKRWGFVSERDGEYAPGPVSLQLAVGFDNAEQLVREARPEMERLSLETGESAGLVVAVKRQVVCLDIVESTQPLRCSFERGRGVTLLRGASAKSLLAFMPRGACEAVLAELMPNDPEPRARMADELDAVRRAGFAVSDSEVDAGIWGVSVPVYRRRDRAAGSLTLMAPTVRATSREKNLIDRTVIAAGRISARLQSF